MIVAVPVLTLLHVPPAVASLKVVVSPSQTLFIPVICDNGFTSTAVDTIQLVPSVYVMLTVPALPPVTIPVLASTVASEIFPLVQVPPLTALLSVVVWPEHTFVIPEINDGNAFTVTALVIKQPVFSM